MPYFTHSFEGPVARFGVGKTRKVWYPVLYLPTDVEGGVEVFPPSRFRVEAEVNGFPTSGAFIPAGDGRRYLILSPDLLRQAELQVSDVVELRFRLDDPDRVDLPRSSPRSSRDGPPSGRRGRRSPPVASAAPRTSSARRRRPPRACAGWPRRRR